VVVVGAARRGPDIVASGSSQVAVGLPDMSSRTEEQAGTLEQTATSLEELTSPVRQNTDNRHARLAGRGIYRVA
jgi:methyl-accepting chemotaxis protein